MEAHPFDQAVRLECVGEGRHRGATHPAYANMAGPFGGIVAAVLLNAVMQDGRRLADPVALTVNFCGAVADGAFEIGARLVRGGKTTQHWSVELIQNGAVGASASIVCGRRKDVWSHYPAKAPAALARERVPQMQSKPDVGWPGRYAFHFAENGLKDFPRNDGELRSPRTLAYIQDLPPRALDFPALAALSDAFFLRIMHVRGTMQPMAIVTMTTYFHVDAEELASLGATPVLGDATASIFHNGFADQACALWTPAGRLIANGAQLTWYKE